RSAGAVREGSKLNVWVVANHLVAPKSIFMDSNVLGCPHSIAAYAIMQMPNSHRSYAGFVIGYELLPS
ncbi:MAG: hypothetical protein M1305_05565, partial [Candidatus Marsarchaeota archaeon]|nr:hypothetical protein [Candidatus Marsarchaeota archaeon]